VNPRQILRPTAGVSVSTRQFKTRQTALHWLFSAPGVITVLLLSPILSGILAMILYSRARQVRAEADFQRERARIRPTV
jgi:phosphate/sulfate permease